MSSTKFVVAEGPVEVAWVPSMVEPSSVEPSSVEPSSVVGPLV